MFWCPIWSIALVLDLFIDFQPNNNFTWGSGPLLCMAGMSPIFYSYVCLYFSTIYFILNILHMDINRSTSPAAQLRFVHLVPLYATYDKYFHLTTMTHFYVYYSTFNSNVENKVFFLKWHITLRPNWASLRSPRSHEHNLQVVMYSIPVAPNIQIFHYRHS